MKRHSISSQVFYPALGTALSCLVFFTLGTQPAMSDEPEQTGSKKTQKPAGETTAKKPPDKTAVTQKGAGAVKVDIDPATGEFVTPSAVEPPAELPAAAREAFSTSSEGLVATESPTPQGGVMIDLKGRFRSPLTATQDADGNISIQHQPKPPVSSKEKE